MDKEKENMNKSHVLYFTLKDLSLQSRMVFTRKFYAILIIQLLLMIFVCSWFIYSQSTRVFIFNHIQWFLWIPFFCMVIFMFFCFWKRKLKPINLMFLTAFVTSVSVFIGTICITVQQDLVINNLLITIIIFMGLVGYTFQKEKEMTQESSLIYSGFAILVIVVLATLIHKATLSYLLIAALISFIFSGFVFYDTQRILECYSEDEVIMASIDLYLDVIHLFVKAVHYIFVTK